MIVNCLDEFVKGIREAFYSALGVCGACRVCFGLLMEVQKRSTSEGDDEADRHDDQDQAAHAQDAAQKEGGRQEQVYSR